LFHVVGELHYVPPSVDTNELSAGRISFLRVNIRAKDFNLIFFKKRGFQAADIASIVKEFVVESRVKNI
jgi:hypothetical protein